MLRLLHETPAMNQQIDIAVDLGVVAPRLPEIEFLREFVANVPDAPPQLIEGILHRIGVRTAYFESCLHCCKGQ
jgi:hypothetical protein